LSAAGLGRLRRRLPDTLLVTDDMQMQGLQKALGTREASLQSLKAGMDMLCIGNNLFDQVQEMAGIAEYIADSLREGTLSGSAIEKSIARVGKRRRSWRPDAVDPKIRSRSGGQCVALPGR
jgi:beta-N-acetylhexosaminidase